MQDISKRKILDKIKYFKEKYEPEGFILLGLFGSFARGEEKETSDIDILFRSNEIVEEKYPGWKFFKLYEQVKMDMENSFKRKIDLTDIDALNKIGKKYILPEVIYFESL